MPKPFSGCVWRALVYSVWGLVGPSGPQDVPHYVGEVTLASLEGNKAHALELQKKRQIAWLKRQSTDNTQAADWRPKTRHRRGAYTWLVTLHNQMIAWLPKGILGFKELVDNGISLDASQWPRLSISPDMGSDGVYMSNLGGCCIEFVWL